MAARGLALYKLREQGECERFCLARSTDPNKLIQVLLHVPIPRFAHKREVLLDFHGGVVFCDFAWSFQE
jgi:hypothetical protein